MGTHSPEEKRMILACNHCYMLGMLATDESYYPLVGNEQQPVTTLKNGDSIVFYIRPLSQDPEPIAEIVDPMFPNSFYIGKDIDQNATTCPSSYYKNDLEQKKKYLYDSFKGKVLLFKPKINFSTKDERVFKNVTIVSIEDIEANKDMTFIPVPVVNMSTTDFQKKIFDGSNIEFPDYNHSMFQPEFIFCRNYLYCDCAEWAKHPSNPKMWSYPKTAKAPQRVKFDLTNESLQGKVISVNENIIFVDKEFLYKNIGSDEYPKEDVEVVAEQEEASASKEAELDAEYKFIEAFSNHTMKYNLYYSIEDLINLHVCVKTNPLTILAGMSGTGKSKLATYYAKMLDLSEENGTLLFLPISPAYTEPGDLLGYLNNTNGLFIPSETGLTDFLIRAKDKPNEMHMVIFDEMNLSQVEYWFAPFISLLEKEPQERWLSLYSPNANCINRHIYKDSIMIGENVKFIGTVNIDETTKDFSDRLLDRANIIALNKQSLRNLTKAINSIDNADLSFQNYICRSASKYQSWYIDTNWSKAYTDDEIDFYDELHKKISRFDAQKGVSFRITKKIGEYLLNIPDNKDGQPMLSKEDAFDLQIKQRLITKIKGTEKQFGKLIGVIRDDSIKEPVNSELYDFFNSDTAQKVSHFKLTKQEIIRKAKELGVYGYAN